MKRKNNDSSRYSEDYVIKHENASDVRKTQKNKFSSLGSENPPTLVKFSAHRLKWIWRVTGKTARKPDKTIEMRNWKKAIYHWGGATIVLNPQTLEVWLKSRPYKNPTKMIYANWNKADRIAREFSKWAQLGIKAIESEHPSGVAAAHLVAETKRLNPYLKPQEGKAPLIGLTFDKSHLNKPEFTGSHSVEGAQGADWLFLSFPDRFKLVENALGGFQEYNRNIQLHLEVLGEMSATMKEIRKALKAKP